MTDPGNQLAATIKRRREEAEMSLSELANVSGVSKGYLWKLEQGDESVRPSGRTLYKIAKALGTSMSELLGRKVLVDEPDGVPDSLQEFARKEHLNKREVHMLAAINFRGRQPEEPEDWAFLWESIQRSVPRRAHRSSQSVSPARRSAPRSTRKRDQR